MSNMKVTYNDLPAVEVEGTRTETTGHKVVEENADLDFIRRVLNDNHGLDVEVTIKFKEPK